MIMSHLNKIDIPPLVTISKEVKDVRYVGTGEAGSLRNFDNSMDVHAISDTIDDAGDNRCYHRGCDSMSGRKSSGLVNQEVWTMPEFQAKLTRFLSEIS
jgi:hypothetical protein